MDVEVRELDDLSWCLIEKRNNQSIESYLKNTDRKPFVVIWHEENTIDNILKVEVFASGKDHILEEVVDRLPKTLKTELNKEVVGKTYTTHLAIKVRDHATDIEKCLSHIFSELLVTGRPLRYYNCTFYLPLDLILDDEILMNSNTSKIAVKENADLIRYKIKNADLLSLSAEEKGQLSPEDIAQIQSYKFFHSQIKDQLFETEIADTDSIYSTKPIKHHQLNLEKFVEKELILRDEETFSGKYPIKANIEDISLYEYYNGLYVLAVKVGLPKNSIYEHISSLCNIYNDDKEKTAKEKLQKKYKEREANYHNICSTDNWWKALVYCAHHDWGEIETLQVDNWLRYTKTVRNLYVGFFEQLVEKKIAPVELILKEKTGDENTIKSQPKEPFSSVITDLIQRFICVDVADLTVHSRLKQIADERMFIHATYVLAGSAPLAASNAENEFERLFSYALYVDEHTDGYNAANQWAYDEKFIQGLMESNISRRWQSIGHLKGFTDYSSVVMGFGDYTHNPLATTHMPYIYGKLQILLLFYKLTLNHFDRRITVATKDQMEKGVHSKSFKELRRSLINFTNKYWFKDLTEQMQGKEIILLMTKHQQLDEKYKQLKDKLDRASEYSIALKDVYLQKKAVFIGWLATLAAVLAFLPNIINTWCDGDSKNNGSIYTLGIITVLIVSYGIYKLGVKINHTVVKDLENKDECR